VFSCAMKKWFIIVSCPGVAEHGKTAFMGLCISFRIA